MNKFNLVQRNTKFVKFLVISLCSFREKKRRKKHPTLSAIVCMVTSQCKRDAWKLVSFCNLKLNRNKRKLSSIVANVVQYKQIEEYLPTAILVQLPLIQTSKALLIDYVKLDELRHFNLLQLTFLDNLSCKRRRRNGEGIQSFTDDVFNRSKIARRSEFVCCYCGPTLLNWRLLLKPYG